ncbi:cation diffusion facilitator family transporter [Pedobacter foliorum]|uniref:cation diffusion facilitator family transporter n=1 Tax=Pedobacter foliorum TaxID=2739058 RepID=UPI0015679B7C|nr:cation diffusion facilitator family transporter [Pedobacter foliorum]NRF42003.1 cation transporter [Pedobacter foliorum]
MELSSKNTSKEAIRTTQLGIIISIALIFVKGLSGYLGHSYALIADATESGADVVSSGLLWLALIYAQRPADQGHPYGHGKAEPVAAVLIGLFLIAAAGWISYNSIYYIRTPHGLPKSYTLIVLLVVILTKELLFRYVLKIGKRLNSQAVKADAYHHRSDAITSIAAFIGIVIALVLGKGYEGADDWAALMACVFIIYNAIKIIRPAFSEIMDAAPSPEFIAEISRIAAQHIEVKEVEKCFVRKMGLQYYVDMHIEVDGTIDVFTAHQVAHQVKDELLASDLSIKDVIIHVEPHLA